MKKEEKIKCRICSSNYKTDKLRLEVGPCAACAKSNGLFTLVKRAMNF